MKVSAVVFVFVVGVTYVKACDLNALVSANPFGAIIKPMIQPGLDTCKRKAAEKKCLDTGKLLILLNLKQLIPKGGDPDCSVLLADYKADNLRNSVCESALNDEAGQCTQMQDLFCQFLSGQGGITGIQSLKDFMVKKVAVDKATEICKQGVSSTDVAAGQSLLGGAGGGLPSGLGALGGAGGLPGGAGAGGLPAGLPAGFPQLPTGRR